MLRFFHSLGAVLWFDDLRETVILDPQWVIDGISRVIRNFELHDIPAIDESLKRGLFEREWEQLTREAKLNIDLLPGLWGDERFRGHDSLLLSLMMRFSFSLPMRGKDKLLLVPPLIGFTAPSTRPRMPEPADDAVHSSSTFATRAPPPRCWQRGGRRRRQTFWLDDDLARLPAARRLPPALRDVHQLELQRARA